MSDLLWLKKHSAVCRLGVQVIPLPPSDHAIIFPRPGPGEVSSYRPELVEFEFYCTIHNIQRRAALALDKLVVERLRSSTGIRTYRTKGCVVTREDFFNAQTLVEECNAGYDGTLLPVSELIASDGMWNFYPVQQSEHVKYGENFGGQWLNIVLFVDPVIKVTVKSVDLCEAVLRTVLVIKHPQAFVRTELNFE